MMTSRDTEELQLHDMEGVLIAISEEFACMEISWELDHGCRGDEFYCCHGLYTGFYRSRTMHWRQTVRCTEDAGVFGWLPLSPP